MKDKKSIEIILSISSFFLFILIVGFSFSYFKREDSQNKSNISSSLSCLDTTISDINNAINLNDDISIDNEEGIKRTPYIFRVSNNCDSAVAVQINIETSSTNTLSNNYVRNMFREEGSVSSSSALISSLKDGTSVNGGSAFKLTNLVLKKNESKNYELRLWIDSSATTSEMNKSFSAKVTINYEPLYIPKLKDLILGAGKSNVSSPITNPGIDVSGASERILAKTRDDYGNSYYFRGAVENNYVKYANMCWRIVRITGDGAIKMTLYNYMSSDNPCNVTGSHIAFALYSGYQYNSFFNDSGTNNGYLGFMYGNVGTLTGSTDSEKYLENHNNINKSRILINLEDWYTNNLSNQTGFHERDLADVIWCNDISTTKDFTFNPWGIATNGLGYGNNIAYYGTSYRLYYNNGSASLICPNDNNGGKLSKFTVNDTINGNGNLTYKIGLLTADEITFAGGLYNKQNVSYYLYPNAGESWWTSSPSMYNSNDARGYFVLSTGALGGSNVAYGYGIRPAIALRSDTLANGTGTKTDPYTIE